MKLTIGEIIFAFVAACLAVTLFIIGVIMLFNSDTVVSGYMVCFLAAIINGSAILILEKRSDNRNN